MQFQHTVALDPKFQAVLENFTRTLGKIMVDISKIKAAEERAVAGIERLLVVSAEHSAQLKALAEQLAVAIAANDPVAQAAVQADLDKAADDLDVEVAKIAPYMPAPAV